MLSVLTLLSDPGKGVGPDLPETGVGPADAAFAALFNAAVGTPLEPLPAPAATASESLIGGTGVPAAAPARQTLAGAQQAADAVEAPQALQDAPEWALPATGPLPGGVPVPAGPDEPAVVPQTTSDDGKGAAVPAAGFAAIGNSTTAVASDSDLDDSPHTEASSVAAASRAPASGRAATDQEPGAPVKTDTALRGPSDGVESRAEAPAAGSRPLSRAGREAVADPVDRSGAPASAEPVRSRVENGSKGTQTAGARAEARDQGSPPGGAAVAPRPSIVHPGSHGNAQRAAAPAVSPPAESVAAAAPAELVSARARSRTLPGGSVASATEATEQNASQDLPSAASNLRQSSMPDAVRVRRATELVRLWRRGSTPTGAEPAAVDVDHARGGPAPAAATPSSTLPGASPDPGTGGTLSLADSRGAAEQLVEQLLQGQARNMTSVRLQLSPAQLGHLQVDVSHRGDRLDIAFTTGHGAARELIEACLPNLKAMLHDAGVQVASVEVRHDPTARDGGRGGYGAPTHDGGQSGQSSDGGQDGGRGRQRDTSAFRPGLPVITPPSVADNVQTLLSGRIDAFA